MNTRGNYGYGPDMQKREETALIKADGTNSDQRKQRKLNIK